MSQLTIKNFNVLDVETGKMQQSGRYTLSQVNNILSHITIINGETELLAVPGTPATISSGKLHGKAHISTSFIKIIHDFSQKLKGDCIFVPDFVLRLTYLGGITDGSNSLLYGFAPSLTTDISSIPFTVIFAKNTSQKIGDYFDINLFDTPQYPNLYIVFVVLNGAWKKRIIVSRNTCKITSSHVLTYCMDPSKSIKDVGKSHFINIQGVNTTYGIPTRVTVGIEDYTLAQTDRDYNDLLFSISSKNISESHMNDNIIN
jgi:hypothetical protein